MVAGGGGGGMGFGTEEEEEVAVFLSEDLPNSADFLSCRDMTEELRRGKQPISDLKVIPPLTLYEWKE